MSALNGGIAVADLSPWLYRITRNAALDAAKRPGYDFEQLSEALQLTEAPEAELERQVVMRETLTSVAALPDNQREALLRVAVEGESGAVAARAMGLSDGALRQLLHRARTTVRAAATAITPLPLVSWAAAMGAQNAPIGTRIAELVAGTSAAGGAGIVIKTGAAVVVAGALAVGPGSSLPGVGGSGSSGRAAAQAPSRNAAVDRRSAGDTDGLERGLGAVERAQKVAPAQDLRRHSVTTDPDSRSGSTGGSDTGARPRPSAAPPGAALPVMSTSTSVAQTPAERGDDDSGSGSDDSGSDDSGSDDSGSDDSGSDDSGSDDSGSDDSGSGSADDSESGSNSGSGDRHGGRGSGDDRRHGD